MSSWVEHEGYSVEESRQKDPQKKQEGHESVARVQGMYFKLSCLWGFILSPPSLG